MVSSGGWGVGTPTHSMHAARAQSAAHSKNALPPRPLLDCLLSLCTGAARLLSAKSATWVVGICRTVKPPCVVVKVLTAARAGAKGRHTCVCAGEPGAKEKNVHDSHLDKWEIFKAIKDAVSPLAALTQAYQRAKEIGAAGGYDYDRMTQPKPAKKFGKKPPN